MDPVIPRRNSGIGDHHHVVKSPPPALVPRRHSTMNNGLQGKLVVDVANVIKFSHLYNMVQWCSHKFGLGVQFHIFALILSWY